MSWVRLDDAFPEHAKVEEAGEAAAWMFVCGLCYCSRALTDGRITTARMRRLCTGRYPERTAERLVSAGLWDRVEGGFRVHDYLHYQLPARDVKARRRANAERQARFRDKQSNTQSNALQTPLVTPPVTPPHARDTRVGSGVVSRTTSTEDNSQIDARARIGEAVSILSAVERWEPDEVGIENAHAMYPGADLLQGARLAVTWASDSTWQMKSCTATLRAALRNLATERARSGEDRSARRLEWLRMDQGMEGGIAS